MPNKLSQFLQELKRRKVLYFLIGYLTACVAIIELSSNASDTFSISKETVKLLYLLSAAGIPVVIILPWVINRKKPITETEETFPEKTSSGSAEEKHNLPAQLTTFIGREKEMQILQDLITEHRLVTIVGAGGCGKTRLAIEVAGKVLRDYKDGVWFVDLAPISMGELVSREIMEVLKINEVPDKLRMDTLLEQIKGKHMLLILDNCEHLVSACAEVTGKLLHSVPELSILTTTRGSLSVKGEQVWRVPSLSLIDPKTTIDVEHARASEAVLLFTDRARLNNPEFNLRADNVNEVVTICHKLDGIPLAVELVASRTKHMNVRMILERFSDNFDQLESLDPKASKRQQTLHATIDWSFSLLSDTEKLLFVRLAVFSGGFDIEAAEEVCSDDQLPKKDILDVLSHLVDRSLVYTTEGADQTQRYNRLETLRQFAWKRLYDQKEEETIRLRHLEYYLALSEKAYLEQFEAQLQWLNKLEQEHDNLVAALNWSLTESMKDFIMLAGYLGWFWYLHAHLILGKNYLEKAMAEDTKKSEAYARVLAELGRHAFYSTEKSEPIQFMKESLEIWRSTKNLREQAIVLGSLGKHASRSDNPESALKYCEESMQLAKEVGDKLLANRSLADLCQSYIQLQKYSQAKPLVQELVDSSEELQQPWEIVLSHHFRGDCALGTRKYKEAEKEYGHAIISAQKFGNTVYVALDLQGVAFALAGQSRWAKSIRLDAAARSIYDQVGMEIDGVAGFWDLFIATYTESAKQKVGEKRTRIYQEEGRAMGTEKAVEYALDFEKD